MLTASETVFLLDVDNTLLDNDRFAADLGDRLEQSSRYRRACALTGRSSVGCVTSSGLPTTWRACRHFALGSTITRNYSECRNFSWNIRSLHAAIPAGAGCVGPLERARSTRCAVGRRHHVFQPRKIQRSGIWDAVEGRVLIYLHKESALDHMQQRYPANHYVMVDDKPESIG